jgi:hypothetical protein
MSGVSAEGGGGSLRAAPGALYGRGGIQSRHSNDVTLCFDEPSPVHTSVCAFVHPEVKSCPDISSSACSQLKLQRGLVKHTM